MKIDIMTKDKDIKTAVPALRFPEFRDAEGWLITQLSELGKTVSGLTYTPSDVRESGLLVLRSSNIKNGRITLDDCVYVTENIKGANLSLPNDILICVRNGSALLIGKNALIPNNIPLCTHGAFMTVFRAQNPDFVFQLLQTDTYQNQVNADLGARINSINNSQLNKYKFAIPQHGEQKKIAECLSNLDDLISAVANKIETLKEYKKGLMQQLFPAEGKTTPAIRFPEFQNTGEWTLLPIKKCNIDILTGYAFKGRDILENNDGTPLMRGINITEGVVRHNNEIDRFYTGEDYTLSKYRLLCNDLVIAMDGSKVGRNFALINKQDVGSLLVQRVARLRADNADFIMFIYQQIGSDRFKTYIDRINTSSGIPHISLKQIEGFEIWTTCNDKEYRMVTNCLSSVDKLISDETNKLDQLKAHKKGLMQQLFPKL